MPAAVFWDLDGTLIDSEPYWHISEFALAAEYGIEWTEEDFTKLVGVDLWFSGRYFIERGVHDMTADQIVERLTGEVISRLREELPFRPGALEMLQSVRDAGIPMGLVTMSTGPIADVIEESLTKLLGSSPFEVRVTGDMVEAGKPDPAPYLLAASMLGVTPGDCIAVEDSFPGARSAKAAGMRTIGIPHHVDVSVEPGIIPWDTLAGKTAEDLRGLEVVSR
ncbi:HAD family hydrolase [Humidisolicoccus flavus]|uniref:HAD family hydrolase n=1 Tax=Humidisolicoccus flavus TaxID=3111414 RepID=UPI00324D3643